MQQASCIMHNASCIACRRLRFGRLTALTNIRSTKRVMVGGRWPLVEEDPWWKTIFGGRGPLVGGRPLVDDKLWWMTTFGGRQPSVEEDLRWKTTFSGRRPLVEDNPRWKTTFGGRWPSLDPCKLPTPLCGILNYDKLSKTFLFIWWLPEWMNEFIDLPFFNSIVYIEK